MQIEAPPELGLKCTLFMMTLLKCMSIAAVFNVLNTMSSLFKIELARFNLDIVLCHKSMKCESSSANGKISEQASSTVIVSNQSFIRYTFVNYDFTVR